MERVLIDKFIVPEESKSAFLEAVRTSVSFLKTLPGFVEGFVYEKTDGDSPHNVMTTAVWANEEAFTNARRSVAEEFQKRGFNPQEIMKRLKVETERAVYKRTPY
jgi:heme-degrading monooxygenase HmoA